MRRAIVSLLVALMLVPSAYAINPGAARRAFTEFASRTVDPARTAVAPTISNGRLLFSTNVEQRVAQTGGFNRRAQSFLKQAVTRDPEGAARNPQKAVKDLIRLERQALF